MPLPSFIKQKTGAARSFLARLARDVRGNTLMIVAAAIFPLIGMAGGAIDLSRLYLVKVRLQHGCDAGALAGRKAMGSGAWTTSSTTSSDAVAKRFFDNNVPSGAYGSVNVTRSFTATGGDVQGSASATVPLTLMAVFRLPSVPLQVTCHAQEQVPNTDVMFVLDNTESMSESPDGSGHMSAGSGTPGSQSKIYNLKADVKCFFEALSKLDTGESSCDAITGVATSSRLRFGLVPYSTNVNISQLGLPATYFAQAWDYQSRYQSGSNWIYDKVAFKFNAFNNSTSSFTATLNDTSQTRSFTWDGCTEENVPLTDVNAIPSTSDATTQIAPSVPGAIYYRRQTTNSNNLVTGSNVQSAAYTTTATLFSANNGHYYYDCPAAAYGLQQYGTSANPVTNFVSRVNAMTFGGNTRHDIGMLWGGRLLSPRGMMASSNGAAPNGGKLYRHIVFMTDGDAKANECDYATYGVPLLDRREVAAGTVIDTSTCGTIGENATLTTGVETRLNALCTAIKSEQDTMLWVISFGSNDSKINADTKNKLKSCATDSNHFFDATSNDQLKLAFKQIAAQISQLRLTQ